MRKNIFTKSRNALRIVALVLLSTWLPTGAWGVVAPTAMLPLNQRLIPQPLDLSTYVKNKAAAIQLGKALFWDMQAGSDGIQACGSCHYSAGADPISVRNKNQVAPGLLATTPDPTFQVVPGPNQTVPLTAFPFHQRQAPVDVQSSPVLRDANDVFGSQGVRLSQFAGITPGSAVDNTTPLIDPVFNVAGIGNVRRVEPRNAPTVINSIFNFSNFWDGRANFIFNGVNPFGPMDQNAKIWVNTGTLGTQPVQQQIAIHPASLASLATGPVLSEFEMSARGRSLEWVGRKMLSLTPLGKQLVHPGDSVLGPISNASLTITGQINRVNGLNTTYTKMIQAAFVDKFWNGGSIDIAPTGLTTQMEANFSLFWGLSIQLYLATLVSDQTPFDSFLTGNTAALTPEQQQGFTLFTGIANCLACHVDTELTGNSTANINFLSNAVNAIFDVMFSADGTPNVYDEGFNNTAVRPSTDDICRGGTAPILNSATGVNFPLSFSSLAELEMQGLVPLGLTFPQFPPTTPPLTATFPVAKDGAFKVPGLRNVALTAPYFHNGSALTLDEVVDFYVRGGNFPKQNFANLDPLIGSGIPLMQGNTVQHNALVAFLSSLTDPRVEAESAPFDHPEIMIPNGDPEVLIRIPAKDALGNAALPPNLSLNPVVTPTNAATQTVSGTVAAGLTPVITASTSATAGPVKVTGTNWSAPISGLAEGVNSITVTVIDPAAKVLEILTSTIVLDTIPPALTINPFPTQTGTYKQTIRGTVEAGIIPKVSVDVGATAGAVTMAGTTWDFPVLLVKGANNITITATDPAGNITTKMASLALVSPDGILSGTGSIAIDDALKALRIATGIVTPSQIELLHGDVAPFDAAGVPSPDGKIDMLDTMVILKKVVGLINF